MRTKRKTEPEQLSLLAPEPPPTATHPTQSAAMSAFIKAIRLRFTEDAIYWLHYLHHLPDQRYKLCRRILLATGEDNLSIPVMQQASKLVLNWKNATLHEMATEVIRICKTQNWWAQEDGHDYIRFWRIITSLPNPFQGCWYDTIRGELAEALAEENRTTSALALIRLTDFKHYNPKKFAEWMQEQTEMLGAEQATETLEIVRQHPKELKFDSNHLAQAHYRLFVGELGEQKNPRVTQTEVQRLLDKVAEKWKNPQPVPSYYLDGIHTKGKDRRFTGIPASMYGMCRAFKKFGRLHPDDQWPADFWWKIDDK